MEINPNILEDVTTQAILLAFAAGATKLVSHRINPELRSTVLPLLFFLFAAAGGAIAMVIPPALYPLLAFAGNAVGTTGGIGIAGDIAKKVGTSSTTKTVVVEAPVVLDPNG